MAMAKLILGLMCVLGASALSQAAGDASRKVSKTS